MPPKRPLLLSIAFSFRIALLLLSNGVAYELQQCWIVVREYSLRLQLRALVGVGECDIYSLLH